MPDIQGGYAANISPAFAGQIADTAGVVKLSRVNETADVVFGSAMIQGTNSDTGAKLGAASVFVGIALREPALPPENGDKYQVGDNVSLLVKGSVWVKTLAASTPGAAVYRTAAGEITSTAEGATLIANAMFETTTGANGIARIRLL